MPSGVTATPRTMSRCPDSVASSSPLARSQTLSVWSSDPETRRVPAGVTATDVTRSVWPTKVWSKAPPGGRRLATRGRNQPAAVPARGVGREQAAELWLGPGVERPKSWLISAPGSRARTWAESRRARPRVDAVGVAA